MSTDSAVACRAPAARRRGNFCRITIVSSALRYQRPGALVDSLLKEIGLSGGDVEQAARGCAQPADVEGPPRTSRRADRVTQRMVKVYSSSVIEAPADRVWAVIRDFNGLPKWHPAHPRQPDRERRAGRPRRLHPQLQPEGGGGSIREQLLTLSDFDFTCTYSILGSPMGVQNYIATLKLTPITGRRPQLHRMVVGIRTARRSARKQLAELVGNGVFQGGFDALKRQVTRRVEPSPWGRSRSARARSSTRPIRRGLERSCATSTAMHRWHPIVAESAIEDGRAADESAACAASGSGRAAGCASSC